MESKDLRDMCLTSDHKHGGSMYGDYIKLPFNPSEKDISEAKALFVKQICEVIRLLSEEDDFFIQKNFPWKSDWEPKIEPYTTLAWRIIFPTLTDN